MLTLKSKQENEKKKKLTFCFLAGKPDWQSNKVIAIKQTCFAIVTQLAVT
jgi:hypothetical protein